MKKVFTAAASAMTAALVMVPVMASASPSAAVEAEAANNKPAVKAAVAKCQTRVKAIASTAGTLTEKYLNPYFVRPSNMADYPVKKEKVLGGKSGSVQTSIAVSGPSKGKNNFVLANDRYKGAAAVAGNAGVDVKALNNDAAALDGIINTWSSAITNIAVGFNEGSGFTKGSNYGLGQLAARQSDQELKAPNSFTLSFGFGQCDTAAGRANVNFMMQRRAIAIRAATKAVVDGRKQVAKAKVDYAKVNRAYTVKQR